MSEKPSVSPEVAALLAAMQSGQHPGSITVKASFAELDGTYSTIEVSVPANADDAEITRRLDLAEKIQGAVRGRFFWGGPEIQPENHIVPFGKHKGLTLGQLAADHPDDLRWLAYEATATSPAFKLAAQWVLERTGNAQQPDGYDTGYGGNRFNGPV